MNIAGKTVMTASAVAREIRSINRRVNIRDKVRELRLFW